MSRWVLAGAMCGLASLAIASPDTNTTLTAKDSGQIAFLSAGSLNRDASGSQLVLGAPIALSGALDFPAGKGPFPLVILAHGCAGVTPTESGWAAILRDWGYATFLMDSFEGRGIEQVCDDGNRLLGIQRIPDAFGAIRRLAKHPRIDAHRIALMGFSHGGILTLTAATAWAKKTFAQAGDPSFRAFFPFYPYCNGDYPERARISAALRVHTGELDDWTPAAPCKRLVDSLKASGQDADISIYAGARHSFDYPELPLTKLSEADNAATCTFRFPSILGPYGPPVEGPGCLRKGATIEGSRQATEQAERNLHNQLSALFKPG